MSAVEHGNYVSDRGTKACEYGESTLGDTDAEKASRNSDASDVDDQRGEDDDDSSSVHVLNDKWTLWYDQPLPNYRRHPQSTPWIETLDNVFTFGTVEDFWRLFNNIKSPLDLMIGANYHLFRNGIKPMWEDERNKLGGKWLIEIDSRGADRILDEAWNMAVLTVIGEAFEESAHVCGVVLAVRKKQYRITVWVKDKNAKDENIAIATMLKNAMSITSTASFLSHDAAIKLGSGYNRDVAMYTA